MSKDAGPGQLDIFAPRAPRAAKAPETTKATDPLDILFERALQATAAQEGAQPQEFDRRHPFERAGLGKPPYVYKGAAEKKYQAAHGAPIQPGSSCDYCGTAIMYEYWYKGSDGKKQFKVGSDCMFKAFREAKDFRAIRLMETVVSKMEKAKREARDTKKIGTGIGWLDSPGVKEVLAKVPHPQPWRAEKGESYLTMVEWYLQNAGVTGKKKILAAAQKVYEANSGKKAVVSDTVMGQRERPKPPEPKTWNPGKELRWQNEEVLSRREVAYRGRSEEARVHVSYLGSNERQPVLALVGPYTPSVAAKVSAFAGDWKRRTHLRAWWESAWKEWRFEVSSPEQAAEVMKLVELY